MAAAIGEDPFRLLPDDLLHHVLSFLPSDDALQTCVLDTRWRDLWRRATCLNFLLWDRDIVKSQRFKQIVKLIIHLRGNSPLLKCEMGSHGYDEDAELLLAEYALMCQVEELVVISSNYPNATRYDAHFISQHLKILELCNVNLEGSSLDFSSCPALEDLAIEHCCIHARSIVSKSLKRLCITSYCTLPLEFRLSIVAPDLISLQLDFFSGLTPSLGDVPFLVSAYVGLCYGCHDFCRRKGQRCVNHECGCHAYPVDKGLLLNRLSNVVSLELIATRKMVGLRTMPHIRETKEPLLLNDWFTPIDLVCILRHSPILEMLTLQLDKTKNLLKATGSQKTIEQPFVCAHLKVVNIQCVKVDKAVCKILEILSTCGVLRDRISIKDTCFDSVSFSFQKPPHSPNCRSSCSSSHPIDVS